MRITIKQLQERIDTINYFTNNKYDIRLFVTTGCGVDISVNGEWKATDDKNHFTNKEAMEFLDKTFNKEIREIIKGLN